jgi:ribose 5-phosphate isomerase A
MPAADAEKRLAARAAAGLVESGMTVGLGTGSTVAFLVEALAERRPEARFVATSPRTAAAAREAGLTVVPFRGIDRLDLAVDGADQVAPSGWLLKGGGGAHTREKVVAAAADRFVVIVSSDKLVDALRPPVPLELLAFGVDATLRALGGSAPLRAGVPPPPDRGLIADYWGDLEDPEAVALRLSAVPGVVEHGLFPPTLLSEVLVARGTSVERLLGPE